MGVATLPDLAQAAQDIMTAGRLLDAKNMAPATSGNYSMRLRDGHIAMTVSGRHKGRLQANDIMTLNAKGVPLENKTPSAEAALHTQIYALFPEANAILHVHSVASVVLTRALRGDLVLAGYEMLKIFPGITTHETHVTIPVFDNAQDMTVLSAQVAQKITKALPVYLIRDHGFYAWAPDMPQAGYLCEALEYMLQCELELLKIAGGTPK